LGWRFGGNATQARGVNVLIDSTVWIDFLRGRENEVTAKLEKCIRDRDDLYCCGFIVTEVLQGIREEKEYAETRKRFAELLYLPDDRSTFELGATIYRELRRKGVTIRNSIDCLIAAVVVQNGVSFLENDRDFRFIDQHFPLNRI
jgi:predicted nucleic acid-binding protein